ncbi:ACT domain-containing protein [Pseudodesulfovibrio sediminis]|uniref:ACT domain-containing protein n=1 Tax=Pseudodesulfovibrio sediminis TaxID=2810563 RepID=A0ABN6ER48_9BACT|nr:ACT domain-containing protein [Pseudodesulfovibrio sediminis]BCS87569.1 hypothetical protein PSDVSF_08110 [Pseudodesulfovibrio sediminis]
MQQTFITTVTGEDSPELLKSLAQRTRTFGGEWLSSKVIKTSGRFAALMKVSIPTSKEEELMSTLQTDYPDLMFSNSSLSPLDKENIQTVSLTIDSTDRPGLTKDICKIFEDMNIIIDSMEIHRFPVVLIGKTVYNAKLVISMSINMREATLEAMFSDLSENVRVTLDQ